MRADLPIEQAAWIGPATVDAERPLFFRLRRSLILPKGVHRFYLSADQRYQLWINGEFCALGPDRSDLHHWSVAGYELETEGGPLDLELRLWWLPESIAPLAQCTHRPGFVLKGEGLLDELLTTGKANWTACDVSDAVSCVTPDLCGFHVVGPSFKIDLMAWDRPRNSIPLAVLRAPEEREQYGARPRGWRMHPSRLPEQRSDRFVDFSLRSLRGTAREEPWSLSVDGEPLASAFQAFLNGEMDTFALPPCLEIECLVDMGAYVCGYPEIRVSGGSQADLTLEWAESLFEAPSGRNVKPNTPKGQRDDIEGKVFHGFGDRWRLSGGREECLPTFWWRSGRYLRLILRTASEPLRLEAFSVRRTGFPFRAEGEFSCDTPGLNDVWPLLKGGLEHCAHEQWVDCPYYEQLSYVGDNTTQLSFYCLTRDDALTRRSLELFDWSRHENGWIAERYPSSIRQDSFTYSMLYPCLVRDYAYWRRDERFVCERLPGIRAMMHECLSWQGGDGLVHTLPGWAFMDWVPEWDRGCPPGADTGDSSLVNLHVSRALRAWADLEESCGDKDLAPWIRKQHVRLNQRIHAQYWSESLQAMADDGSHQIFSEHAQVWAILEGLLTPDQEQACLRTWLSKRLPMAPMSLYFSHYGFEALYRKGQTEVFLERLQFWNGLNAQGFCTTPERPEPSRSDCHGWGAHPLFHFFASLAGIRPASPGFRTVLIAPLVGALTKISLTLPHPEGTLRFDCQKEEGALSVRIFLPGELSGDWIYANESKNLVPGDNAFSVPFVE